MAGAGREGAVALEGRQGGGAWRGSCTAQQRYRYQQYPYRPVLARLRAEVFVVLLPLLLLLWCVMLLWLLVLSAHHHLATRCSQRRQEAPGWDTRWLPDAAAGAEGCLGDGEAAAGGAGQERREGTRDGEEGRVEEEEEEQAARAVVAAVVSAAIAAVVAANTTGGAALPPPVPAALQPTATGSVAGARAGGEGPVQLRQAVLQAEMCAALNQLAWVKVAVDTGHFDAHAAIVVRSGARFGASHGHIVEYAVRQMRGL
jgi:hypothetical protein